MIQTTYNPETNEFLFHSTYEENVRVDFTILDLNTTLGVTAWWIGIGKGQYCHWILPQEYTSTHYFSGFILKGYIGDELVVNEKFQFKKSDDRFKFVTTEKEICFGSWDSLVYGDEYASNFATDDVIYDLGANFGVYTMWAHYHKVKQIYAFEPTPKNAECLRETFKWDNNIQIIEKAISNKHEVKKFYTHEHSIANSLNYDASENFIEVECINLEQYIKENKLLRPTIVKCDIEGSEYEFIESLNGGFFQFIKTFIVEFHLNNENKIWPIVSKLLDLGYSIRMVQNNYTTNEMGTLIAKR
jgi:hypothetical protein